MTDPKITLLDLFKAQWSLSYAAVFSTDWYDAKLSTPQVCITHMITMPSYLGFTDNPTTATKRYRATYLLNAFMVDDKEKRYETVKELNRIIQLKCNDAGGGIEFIETGNWRDLDETQLHPKLYRSQLQLSVLYYE